MHISSAEQGGKHTESSHLQSQLLLRQDHKLPVSDSFALVGLDSSYAYQTRPPNTSSTTYRDPPPPPRGKIRRNLFTPHHRPPPPPLIVGEKIFAEGEKPQVGTCCFCQNEALSRWCGGVPPPPPPPPGRLRNLGWWPPYPPPSVVWFRLSRDMYARTYTTPNGCWSMGTMRAAGGVGPLVFVNG